jgi:hypothetical protein
VTRREPALGSALAIALAVASSVAGGCGVRQLQAVALPAPICEEPTPDPAQLVDQLTFGDPASEKAHVLSGASAGTQLASGAFGQPARRIDVGAPLVFQMACDPNVQNYLTVKLWGSDRDAAVLFLYVAGTRVGSYQQDLPELDLSDGEAAFPDRFLYVTYPLPRSATDGTLAVPLKIDAVGAVSAFAPPGQQEQSLTHPTRPIYRAYVHRDPFFVPSGDESQGDAPVPAVRSVPAGYPDVAGLHQATDAAVTTLLGWQLYGDSWSAAVASGQVPTAVAGLFAAGTSVTRFSTPAAWKDWATSVSTAANAAGLNALAVLALVHASPWSQYHGSGEILSRVTRALDSLALMQGSNGAFTSATWVGAPGRTPAMGSGAEGSGTKALGRAFLILSDALAASGALAVAVDHDDDATTPPVPRAQAWADMFARHRDFLASPAGRSRGTMYDQSQMEALWLANQAVAVLAPARAWPRETALSYVASAIGLADGPFGGRSVTAAGLALEPTGTLAGGYDGRWGLITIRSMCALAQLTADANVRGRCLDAVHAAAPFLYPSTDAGMRTMRSESAISTIINRNPGFVEYGGNAYAADTLGDPVALRALQLRLADHLPLGPPAPDGHFEEYLAWYLQDLPTIERAATLPVSAYRFPMEEGQPSTFVWADQDAGVTVVRNCGDRLYASLNWRRGFTDDVADAQHARVNNIARVHATRDRYDRIATIVMDSPAEFGRFYTATFGPYLIGMNLTADSRFELPGFAPASSAFELMTGATVTATAKVPVPARETRLLYRQRP